LRHQELSVDDLEAILYWYTKAFEDDSENIGNHKNTLIKIQAMAIYAQEDEDWKNSFFKRRMK
jgi:hypothetical protein